jgi:hypothetical protein
MWQKEPGVKRVYRLSASGWHRWLKDRRFSAQENITGRISNFVE